MMAVIGEPGVRRYRERQEERPMAHECGCNHAAAPMVLDVRDMAPRIRHPKIFETFDALAPGTAFVLVNDHDPKPLFYQFEAERKGTFRWRYLEEGPEV